MPPKIIVTNTTDFKITKVYTAWFEVTSLFPTILEVINLEVK
jgi:phosphoribosylpyrophosphate synthetase